MAYQKLNIFSIIVAAQAALAQSAPAMSQTLPAGPAAVPANNTPQPIVRSVLINGVNEEFKRADINGDGFVDRNELVMDETRRLQDQKALLLRSREVAFDQMDRNHDGSLSKEEFNYIAKASPLPTPNPVPTLDKFDRNKDGKISRDENIALLIAQFDNLDKDKNGILMPDELPAQ